MKIYKQTVTGFCCHSFKRIRCRMGATILLTYYMMMLGFAESECFAQQVAEKVQIPKRIDAPEKKGWGLLGFVDVETSWEEIGPERFREIAESRAVPLDEVVVPPRKKVVLIYRDAAAADRDLPLDFSPLDQFETNELLALFTPASIIAPDEVAHLKRHKALQYLALRPLCTVSDEAFAQIAQLAWLEVLEVPETDITDTGLRHVRAMKNLQKLNLYGTDITDAGLEHLEALTKLRILNLGRIKTSDAGLKHLAKLKKLQSLDLHDTQISDAGLKHLQELPSLSSLNLEHTRITEAGLKSLATLPKLRKLYLSPRQIPEESLEQFKKTSPKVQVVIPKILLPNN